MNAHGAPTGVYPLHFESSGVVRASAPLLFAHLDEHARLSSHMNESSWMMAGGRMDISTDEGHGQRVGSRIRVAGSVLGLPLSVDEVVVERDPPWRKVWETIGVPRLVVIGEYRMGFEVTSTHESARLRVFIDYSRPETRPGRWLGYLFSGYTPNGVLSGWSRMRLQLLTAARMRRTIVMLIPRLLTRTIRPIAGVMVLALALVSSAECLRGSMSAQEMACCAAMKGDCHKKITSCCTGEAQSLHSVAATKPVLNLAPTQVLVALLQMPVTAVAQHRSFKVPDLTSAGPPGVSTFLFVSSFRI
jgi:hypothetical protein